MGRAGELARLTSQLPTTVPADLVVLEAAARALNIEWPEDYVALMQEHNGAEGWVGHWYVHLDPVERLTESNSGPQMEFFPGIVFFGGDGGGEGLAFDRQTREVLLVPWIGDVEDWIVLGATLTEAFQAFERDDVFASPRFRSAPTDN